MPNYLLRSTSHSRNAQFDRDILMGRPYYSPVDYVGIANIRNPKSQGEESIMPLSLSLARPTRETSLSILDRVKTCKSLPVLSPLASKILKMCEDEKINASDLAQLISQDSGMVAQILFMANSAYYGGLRHKVTSVVQAVNLLGFSTIANLALSLCFSRLIKDLRQTNRSGMDHVGYWRRSIFASAAGRALAHHLSFPDPDLVFLGALLQDIGILALNEVVPEKVEALYGKAADSHVALPQRELEQLGVDHSQVGAWLAQHWELPEEFQLAILYHHTPAFSTSRRIANRWSIASRWQESSVICGLPLISKPPWMQSRPMLKAV